ncbi:multicopper oxidase domain-containing protein [Nocardioides seonyuensis]|nr:multicopper oxidase domain-containing protein [Nocardioides seonyuensis]
MGISDFGRGSLFFAVLVALALALAPSSAGPGGALTAAADPAPQLATILIELGGAATGYATPNVAVAQGGEVTVVNNDSMAHTVTSDAVGTDGDPLFHVVVPARTTRTLVIARLAGGKYAFFCGFHPSMRGTLTIEGDATGEIPTSPPFDQPLRIPKVLTGNNVTIPMRMGKVRVMASGPRTRMWTYAGSFPGPTIKRPTGRATKVTFVHQLPRKAGSMSVHNHGGHQSSRDDGQPTRYLIGKGGRRTYTYPLTDFGAPVPAYFAFYHDHKMDVTARNNWRGLQGMFLVTDPRERRLRLPTGKFDVPLHFSDRSFTRKNQLTNPFPSPGRGMHHWMNGPKAPPNDATVGSRILVNGQYAPYLRVKPGLYRLRLLNASLFSAYDFALSNGSPFVQVGTGNGLLPKSVVRQDLLLGPAQRADVIVDFRRQRGENVLLRTIPRSDDTTGTGSRSATLMQFRVRGSTDQTARIPARLTKIENIKAPRKVAKTWTFGLSETGRGSFWSINGKMFDPGRVDHKVRMNSVERWRLRNVSDMTHYVHLHEERWQTLSRNGDKPPPWEKGYEDTWRLDPGETVDVFARFTDYPGLFMVHCHMLNHEDHGMMAQFKVLPTRSP